MNDPTKPKDPTQGAHGLSPEQQKSYYHQQYQQLRQRAMEGDTRAQALVQQIEAKYKMTPSTYDDADKFNKTALAVAPGLIPGGGMAEGIAGMGAAGLTGAARGAMDTGVGQGAVRGAEDLASKGMGPMTQLVHHVEQLSKAGLQKTARALMKEGRQLLSRGGSSADRAAGDFGGGLSKAAPKAARGERVDVASKATGGGRAAAKRAVKANPARPARDASGRVPAKTAAKKTPRSMPTSNKKATKKAPSQMERDVRANLKQKPAAAEYKRAQGKPPGKASGQPRAKPATSSKNLANRLQQSVRAAQRKKKTGSRSGS